MQIPLQITFRDLPHSPVLDSQIRRHAEKLDDFHNHLMACKIVIDMPQNRQHQGKLYNIRINLTVPGKELVVTHNVNEDFFIALREAFDDAKRQLEEIADKRHRTIARANHQKLPKYGYVTQLFPNEGYGFIETVDGHEVYFHECVVTPTFKQLKLGTEVQFLEESGEKGPQAARVKIKKSNYH